MKLYQKRSAVLRAAHAIKKASGLTFSEAQKEAWRRVKSEGEKVGLLEFRKVSGEVCRRLVYTGDLGDLVTFQGNGRKLSPGCRLFVDLAKVWAGAKNAVISVYSENIYSLTV